MACPVPLAPRRKSCVGRIRSGRNSTPMRWTKRPPEPAEAETSDDVSSEADTAKTPSAARERSGPDSPASRSRVPEPSIAGTGDTETPNDRLAGPEPSDDGKTGAEATDDGTAGPKPPDAGPSGATTPCTASSCARNATHTDNTATRVATARLHRPHIISARDFFVSPLLRKIALFMRISCMRSGENFRSGPSKHPAGCDRKGPARSATVARGRISPSPSTGDRIERSTVIRSRRFRRTAPPEPPDMRPDTKKSPFRKKGIRTTAGSAAASRASGINTPECASSNDRTALWRTGAYSIRCRTCRGR